ncbi:MAG TPA: site-2 protease family protein [Polyangiaceae bacterium]
MTTDSYLTPHLRCANCGGELAPALLACPSCRALVHAPELKSLAAEAELAESQKRYTAALTAWRRALTLLPTDAKQYQLVLQRVQEISTNRLGLSAEAASPETSSEAGQNKRKSKWAGLAALGALLAKFKWAILFLLGKGKLLLTGLLQLKTVFSMLLVLGLYSRSYGWQFALGLVLSIYIHEMGHVASLRHFGIPASAPMFIPYVGAFVRLKQYPATPAEDARVGLAGPIWGTAAAVGAIALGLLLHSATLLAIGRMGAWINLFNLVPVWQLDGSRGFTALTQKQRIVVALVLWALVLCGIDGIFIAIAAVASYRAISKGNAPATGDRPVLVTYLALAVGLGLIVAFAKAEGIR